MIPFQARNPKTGAWEPDGMDKAKARCEAVFAALESKKMTFDEALNEHAEFFANDDKRGRLGFLPLNQLKQQLRENEFTQLLDGFSISNHLFFDAEVGKTFGPIAGPDGYFIARVNARTPARRKIDVKNEQGARAGPRGLHQLPLLRVGERGHRQDEGRVVRRDFFGSPARGAGGACSPRALWW